MKENYFANPLQAEPEKGKKPSRLEKATRALIVAAALTVGGSESAPERKVARQETGAPDDGKKEPEKKPTPTVELKPKTAKPVDIGIPAEEQKVELALDWKTEDPAFFVRHENGEYTAAERAARRRVLPNGEKLLIDAGIAFYLVEKGDTIFGIKQKLSQYDDFKYLSKQKAKIKSFNIPPNALQPGMWIPIPLEEGERVLADEKFVEYACVALDELKEDSRYGRFIDQLLETISKDELLATMLAVAKQESGGAPLGQFEFHRYEKHHRAFSFSLFHVLMKGAGLDARRNLDLTEGQLYHPKNAAKLFVGFMFEKMNADRLSAEELKSAVGEMFPINQHVRNFSRFYNGKLYWKAGYDKKILKHRADAVKTVEKLERSN